MCNLWPEPFLAGLAWPFFFLSPDESFLDFDSLWRLELQHGVVCKAVGVLEPWELVARAFESFFLDVTLVEPPPWLLSPSPPLLGLLSEPAADFLSNLGTPFCGCAEQKMTRMPALSTFCTHRWRCSALL